MFNFNWSKRNTVIAISVAVYAALALLLTIIINNREISLWINKMLSVLAPLIVGAAIAYLCSPILNFFEKKMFKFVGIKQLRRVLSIVSTYLLLTLVITTILLIAVPQIKNSYNDLTENLSSYTTQAINYVNRVITRFDASIDNDQIGEYIKLEQLQAKVTEWFTDTSNLMSRVGEIVKNYGQSVLTGVKNTLLGLFISIYILSSKERLAAQLKKLSAAIFNKERSDALVEWTRFTNVTFGRYIKAQLLDALLVTIECGIVFSIAGMPYALLLSFMIGVTNIIPVFGPFIGGIPAGFIVLISDPSKLLLFAVLLLLIQQIDGNIVLPKLVGSTTGMTSFGVLCAIIIMGGYFGVVGMILGVPVFVVVGELIRRLVNASLKNKGMEVSLAEYYSDDALIVSEEYGTRTDKKLISRFFKKIGQWLKKLFSRKK